MLRQIDLRIVQASRELLELLGQRLADAELGQEIAQRAADDLRFGVAEHALAGRIDGGDVTALIDREDRVLDVVQHGLELAGGAFAKLPRQRGGFIGHQLHGAHDAAALLVRPRVHAVDRGEQTRQIQLPVLTGRLPDLLIQQSMHSDLPHDSACKASASVRTRLQGFAAS